MLRLSSALAALCLALACAAPALAQDDEWHFRVAPYLLAPVMNGDVVVRGNEAEADLGPDDIFSNLNFGFQGWLEARTDGWGVALDVIYMDLDATDDDRVLDIDVNQSAYTAIAFVRTTPTLDVYAGARYNDLGGDLDFEGPLNLPTVSQDRDWIDPLVGLRFTTPIGERWNFQVSGDVGGFGLGSDLAINFWPMVGYELSDSAQLAFGYRAVYTDYDSGTGANRFAYDVLTHGPVIGAALDF
jgi:hypothetical protein